MFIKNGEFRKYTHIISYVPPFIIEQPTGGIVEVNNPFEFKIRVRGSRPISYQWYRNDVLLDGETESILSFLSCQAIDNGSYVCKVSNNNHVVYSNSANLVVLAKPVILTNPVSLSAIPSTIASFSVSVAGSEPLTFDWYKNDVIYSTSTSRSLFINDVKKSDEGIYYVIASNPIGNVTSLTASLYVYDKLEIVTQPSNLTLNPGQTSAINLSCVGTTPISAQWRKNNINYGSQIVSNGHYFNLDFNNLQLSDQGDYDCVLTNIVGSITSNKSQVYPNGLPAFTLQPVSAFVHVGDTTTFTVDTSGTAPINFQWIKTGSGNITGKINNTYSILDTQLSDIGSYACVATNIVGSVTSEFVTLSATSSYLLTENDEYIVFDNNTYWNIEIEINYLVTNNRDNIIFNPDDYWVF